MLVRRNKQTGSRRRGVTIVELLIVVGIFAVLAAVALPTVRSLMNERKTSQAALLIKNYLEAARARAIARNKPIAVVLERLSSRAIRDPADPSQLISVVASDTDLEGNFAVYNSSIRLSMAEQPAPVQLDGVGISQATDKSGQVIESTYDLQAVDQRLLLIEEGAELEFPDQNGISRRLRVERWHGQSYNTTNATNVVRVTVDNYGSAASPYGVATDGKFGMRLAKRKVLRPHVPFEAILPIPPRTIAAPTDGTALTIYPTLKPTSVQVLDLPRGTCVDLSLSGMANDSPLVLRGASPVLASRRDTRRMFASNWSYTDPSALPLPQDLRPVYLVFGSGGTLERVVMNDFGTTDEHGILSNPQGGNPDLETYEALEDVFLFVGRTDQVLDAVSYADVAPEVLENQSLEANLNDSTANWVRISPSSGAIAVAPVAAFADGGPVAADVPIGQLLMRSRKLSFTDTETAQ